MQCLRQEPHLFARRTCVDHPLLLAFALQHHRWVIECAAAQQRLREAAFPVHLAANLLEALQPGKEQAAPNCPPPGQQAASKGGALRHPEARRDQAPSHLPAATLAAAAARAQWQSSPGHRPALVRPLGSSGQPSLHTQAPSIKHSMPGRSVHWQEQQQQQQQRRQGGAASETSTAAQPRPAAGPAAAAVLPVGLEHQGRAEQDEGKSAWLRLSQLQQLHSFLAGQLSVCTVI